MSTDVKIRPVEMIPIHRIHPNEWNPNVQTDETFNKLVEEIREDGFDHPLNVVPIRKEDYDEAWEDQDEQHYKIIGGEQLLFSTSTSVT